MCVVLKVQISEYKLDVLKTIRNVGVGQLSERLLLTEAVNVAASKNQLTGHQTLNFPAAAGWMVEHQSTMGTRIPVWKYRRHHCDSGGISR
jgi:hypothetical protein